MMKKIQNYSRFLSAFFAITLLVSCTSTAKVSSAKTIEINASVLQKPTVADLVVKDSKVTATASGKTVESLEKFKSEAVAAALKTVSADVLIGPQFDYTFSNNTTTVTVSGFPGTYKNFRPLKAEDIPLLQSGAAQQVQTFTPPVVNTKKSSNAAWIIIGAAVLGGLIYATSESE